MVVVVVVMVEMSAFMARNSINAHCAEREREGEKGGTNKQTKQKHTKREDPSDRHRRTRKRKPLKRKAQHRIPVTMYVKRTRP